LLRGINVGGNHMLPMKDLAEIFGKTGCAEVRTYIQSGNVVFKAPSGELDEITSSVAKQITKRFGFTPPVILRTLDQIGDVIRNNPFLKRGADEKALHVSFLADQPDPKAVNALDVQRFLPDELIVRNLDMYLFLPNGMGNSKLMKINLDSKLATRTTARNWRTVQKLFELMQGL
jgi:uncharacterized protein (DUF1697 family)